MAEYSFHCVNCGRYCGEELVCNDSCYEQVVEKGILEADFHEE